MERAINNKFRIAWASFKTRSITYIGITGTFDACILYFEWLLLVSKSFFNKMVTMKTYHKETNIVGKNKKLTALILADASQDF